VTTPAAGQSASPATRDPGAQDRPARRALVAALVVLAAVVVLLPTMHGAFIYDDTTIIRDNGWLRGWSALWRAFGQPYWPTTEPDALGLYRPVHIALLATIWNATAGSARAFHLYALALAAVTALAVWWMLRRATTAGAALVAVLWFATHPLHIEAEASVANSSELLVVLGTVLLMRLLAGNHARDGWRRAIAMSLVAAATLLSKESGLFALPLALLTCWGWRDLTARMDAWRTVGRTHARAIVLSLAALALALVARHAVLGAAIAQHSIAAQGLGESAADRVPAMLSLWPRIGLMLVWPNALAPYYGPTLLPPATLLVAVASLATVLLALGLALLALRRGDRRPVVALGWIALTYFPASNLAVPTGQILSDRTLFGATVGVAMLGAWAVDVLPRRARPVVIALFSIVVAHGAWVSIRYARTWTSHRALWTQLIHVEPREHLGYKLLGMDARARGEHAQAVALLARADSMAPSDRQIRFELGEALYESQRFSEAARVFGSLSRDTDVRAEAGFVSLYLDAVGRSGGANAVIEAARPLAGTPATATAALYAGMALERLGRAADADSAFRSGLAARPRDPRLSAALAALATGRARRR
jgi:tetratricopeptide (TPR) repeat protein